MKTCWMLLLTTGMAARLETDGIDGAVHLIGADDLRDHVAETIRL